MKRIAVLILAAAFALAPLAPAAATSTEPQPTPPAHRTVAHVHTGHHALPYMNGYPLCVSTKWAARYYGAPKTQPGQSCFVRMYLNPLGVVSSATDPSRTFAPKWYPRAWSVDGWLTDSTGDVVAQIVTRPW